MSTPPDRWDRVNGDHTNGDHVSGDRRLEAVIGHLLRAGVTLSAVVMVTGGILYLRHPRAAAPDYTRFHPSLQGSLRMGNILAGVAHGSGPAILMLGILLLIATPVVRVVFALAGFLLERDILYTVVSGVVLAILLLSLVHGR